MSQAHKVRHLFMSLMTDGLEWGVRRVQFASSVATAGKALGIGGALFLFLHVIPRYLFNAYGVIWGTIVPIIAAVVASFALLYAIFQALMLGIAYVRMNWRLARICGRPYYCKVCSKTVAIPKDQMVMLVNAQLQASQRSIGMGRMEPDIPVLCSEECAKKLEQAPDTARYCWRCGKELTGLSSCMRCERGVVV
ncbi:MAG: hypothetical protein KKI12_03330 [Proteobacteria bacterium]|nr:hypothetical protein [Patescibacteria group bacterium]MBU4287186.1 hypothetical protein [Pseudomonadota bacterium]